MYADSAWQLAVDKILHRRDAFRMWYPKGVYVLVCVKTGAHVVASCHEDSHGGHVAAFNKFEKKYGLSPYRECIGFTL